MKDSRPDSSSRQRPGSGTERPTSASRARTDSITSIEVSSQSRESFSRQPSNKVTFLSGLEQTPQFPL